MKEEDVVIVANTKMYNNRSCVGGFVLETGRPVRIMKQNGNYQDYDHPYEIGDIFTLKFNFAKKVDPPHTENILVAKHDYKESLKNDKELANYLIDDLGVNIWEGGYKALFDGILKWTESGSGFINKDNPVPDYSTGFWIPDKDLDRDDFKENVRFNYPVKKLKTIYGKYFTLEGRVIKYVGYKDAVDLIPAGTLLRVSLARWWDTNGTTEDRCYLQLSGWYDL